MNWKHLILICAYLFYGVHAESDSRADEIARKKAEKARQLHPYVPGKAESIVTRVTRPRKGLYPYVGSAFSGGGIAAGPGYLMTFGDNGVLDIHGAWSIENYRMVEIKSKLPDLASGRLITRVEGKYAKAGHLSFFGLGNDTEKEDETNFEYRPVNIELTETFQPVKWFFAGGGVEYMHIHTGEGDSDSLPSTEDVFPPSEIPGFGVNPDYINTSLFAGLDWRETPGYTTSGGYFSTDFKNYSQRGGHGFSFQRYDVELDQYFPIFRANQIIVARGLVSITDTDEDNEVPFFLMPRLGGSRDLRGFRGFRFRDRHRLLFAVEYRWTPSKLMDLAIFYEKGKVAAETEDLDFRDLHSSYGIGMRIHAPNATILRIELGLSNEYTRLIFATGLLF